MNSTIQGQNFQQHQKTFALKPNTRQGLSAGVQFGGYLDDYKKPLDDEVNVSSDQAQKQPVEEQPKQDYDSSGAANYTNSQIKIELQPPSKWKREHKKLWNAIEEGDYNHVNRYITKNGPDIIEPEWHNSALIKSIINDQWNIFSDLMTLRAEVNHHNKEGHNALTVAIQTGKFNYAEELLKSGRMDKSSLYHPDGKRLLDVALMNDKLDLAKLLVQAGDDVNGGNVPPVFHAIIQKNMNALKFLVEEAGANVNDKDASNGQTIIDLAVMREASEMIEYLVNKGADINAKTIGKTPLIRSIEKSSKAFTTLLNLNASITETDDNGENVLHHALKSNPNLIATIVSNSGYSASDVNTVVNQANNDGITPAILAAAQKQTDALTLILDKGADITAKDTQGYTIMDSLFGNPHTQGFTPLQTMSGGEASEVLEALNQTPDKKALKELLNTPIASNGTLPLEIVIQYFPSLTQTIIDMGADPLAKNANGENAFQVNLDLKDTEDSNYNGNLFTLLDNIPEAKRADVWNQTETGNDGQNILMDFVATRSTLLISEVLPRMLSEGADLLATDSQDKNSLDLVWGGKFFHPSEPEILNEMLDALSPKEQKTLLDRNSSSQFNLNSALSNNAISADFIKNLLDRGADITKPYSIVSTAFNTLVKRAAANASFTPILKSELEKMDADKAKELVNELDANGRSPLMEAVATIQTPEGAELAGLLMSYGADASAQDLDGNTFQSLFKSQTGQPLIHLLAGQGEHKLLQQFIDNNVDINEKDTDGNTAVAKAVKGNQLDTLKLLIKNNANINIADNDGNTPLMKAAFTGKEDIVNTLIEAGANLDPKNNSMQSALHLVAQAIINVDMNTVDEFTVENYKNILNTILSKDVDLEARDASDKTVLHHAVDANNVNLINTLLEADADIEAPMNTKKDYTPLLQAINKGHKEAVLTLLKAGANPNAELHTGAGLLEMMIQGSRSMDTLNPEFLKEVLGTEGVNVDNANNKGITPLMQAILTGNADAAAAFLEAGADLKAEAKNGATIEQMMALQGPKVPLAFWLYKTGRTDLFETFLKAGADFNGTRGIEKLLNKLIADGDADTLNVLLDNGVSFAQNDQGQESPLHFAFSQDKEGSEAIALKLLNGSNDKGALKAPMPNGNSLLMEATGKGWSSVVDVLLKDADNINAQHGKTGETPLIQAVKSGDPDTVEKLLGKNADVNIADKKGYTALDYAVESNYYYLASTLMAKEPKDLNHTLSNNQTLLMRALSDKQYDFAQTLMTAGAEGSTELNVDGEYSSALIQSVREQDLQSITLLLDNGVKVTANNKPNGTNAVRTLFKMMEGANGYTLEALDNIGEQLLKEENLEGVSGAMMLPASMMDKNILNETMQNGMDKTVQALLNLKIGLTDKIDGKTLLMIAAETGNNNTLKMLLNHDNDINSVSDNGKTALHLAVENNQVETVKTLINQKNIDLEAKDKQGMTPFLSAVINHNEELINLLAEKGADTKATVTDGQKVLSPMLLALKNGKNQNKLDLEFLQKLVDAGVDINQSNEKGVTPLIFSLTFSSNGLTEFLLNNGADPHLVISDKSSRFVSVYEVLIFHLKNRKLKNPKEVLKMFDVNLNQLENIVRNILTVRKEGKEVTKAYLDNLVSDVKAGKPTDTSAVPANDSISEKKFINKTTPSIKKDADTTSDVDEKLKDLKDEARLKDSLRDMMGGKTPGFGE